ncbi:MAG: hypothetical protein LBT59_06530 [Clostridiales bacterium]|jgi:hypothetical protein|nr:hypothetical protein [Clostridiales bacterium]
MTDTEFLVYPQNELTKKAFKMLRDFEKKALARNDWEKGKRELIQFADAAVEMGKQAEGLNQLALYVLATREVLTYLKWPVKSVYDEDLDDKAFDLVDLIWKFCEGIGNSEICEDVFNLVFKQVIDNPEFDPKSRRDLRTAVVPCCANKNCRAELEKHLEKLDRNDAIVVRKDLILEFEGEEAARAFMKANAQFVGSYARFFIEENDESEELEVAVLKLWHDRAKGDGLSSWRYTRVIEKYLVKASERAIDINRSKRILKELASVNYEYFPKFKSLHSEDEWKDALEGFASSVEDADFYPELIDDEDMKERMLELCKQMPRFMLTYYDKLLPDYRDEFELLYKNDLRDRVKKAREKDIEEISQRLDKCEEIFGLDNGSFRKELMGLTKSRALLRAISKADGPGGK